MVVYNASVPDSLAVADHYRIQRGIPQGNLCALTQITTAMEAYVTIAQYQSVVKPQLTACLNRLGATSILYIVFAYRTPYKVTGVPTGKYIALDSLVADIWSHTGSETTPQTLNRYYARADNKNNSYKPFQSFATFRSANNHSPLLYVVFRLDGPTLDIANSLVDKAIQAELNGVDGQGCFDRRYGAISSVDDTGYGAGDWDIYKANEFTVGAGIPTTDDATSVEIGTAPAPLRCDTTAYYAGWYSYANYNDAFTFSPGAIGFHLDSASATNPRSFSNGANWVAGSLRRGITFTSGAVGEPYLTGLVHPAPFMRNILVEGANVGDALYRNLYYLHWMVINVGDPLYRPSPKVAPQSTVPTKIVLSGATSIAAGTCSLYVVTAKDAENFPGSANDSLLIQLTATGSGKVYGDASCASSASTLTLQAGTAQAFFYVKNTTLESFSLTATDTQNSFGTSTTKVDVHRAQKLAVSGAVSAGNAACSKYVVTMKDSMNFPDVYLSDRTIIASTSGTGRFYDDATCTHAASSMVIPQGKKTATFYYEGNTIEKATLTFKDSLSVLTQITASLNITGPTKLSLAGVNTFKKGICTAYSVGLLNASGSPSQSASSTTVDLTSTLSGRFYLNSSCSQQTTNVTLPANTQSVTVYATDSVAESITLTATSAPLTSATKAVAVK